MDKRLDVPPEKDTQPRWTHLPPVDSSLLLRQTKNGSVKAVEKYETPVDDFGIPLPDQMLEIALSTLAADHVFPLRSNRHHHIYPRDRYHNHPSGSSIPKQFRESAALIYRYPQQLHNYLHELFYDPQETSMDVMYQWVKEQEQINQLFYVGQTAIQLSRAKYPEITDDTVRHHLRLDALRDSKQIKGIFYDFLDSYPDSQVGLMPDREWLAGEDFPKAVRALGVLAGARSLDARRETQEKLKKIGFQTAA